MKTIPTVVQLSSVRKIYELHHEKPTMTERLLHGKREQFVALNDINLTIRKGEKLGIIGSNGSGKTTLLKTIARISTPTSGSITLRGKVVSLIDLEAGFHPDLSGIQNIFLNGMLLGLSHKQIQDRLKAIVTFADIKQFIDAPLYTYSSGMKLRLGFSIAIQANPDILLLDESINVGDQRFKDKIRKSAKQIFRDITLIVVSHDMYAIVDYCTRIIVMEQGKQLFDGPLKQGLEYYYQGKIPRGIAWYMKHHKKLKQI